MRALTADREITMSEMKDEQNRDQSKTTQSDLVAELGRLGENLGKLLKASLESDEVKSIERELKTGLDQFSKEINKAVEQAHAEHTVKRARDTFKDAWETAHGPQVLHEMHLG